MLKELFSTKLRSRTISYLVLIILLLMEIIFESTGNLTNLIKSLLVPLTCYLVAALSLNLVVGFSGELSLGQAGFMSIGSFSAIILSKYCFLCIMMCNVQYFYIKSIKFLIVIKISDKKIINI